MKQQIDALKLALAELVYYRDYANCPDWREKSQVAIVEIQRALAQKDNQLKANHD